MSAAQTDSNHRASELRALPAARWPPFASVALLRHAAAPGAGESATSGFLLGSELVSPPPPPPPPPGPRSKESLKTPSTQTKEAKAKEIQTPNPENPNEFRTIRTLKRRTCTLGKQGASVLAGAHQTRRPAPGEAKGLYRGSQRP